MENERQDFLKLARDEQRSALEAIIFASDEALTFKALYNLLLNFYDTSDDSATGQDDETGENQKGEEPASEEVQDAAATLSGNGTVNAEASQQAAARKERKEYYSLFEELIEEINIDLQDTNRAFQIVKVAGGYQFATRPEYGELVAQFVKSRSKRRMSRAALETLAIAAYRQPITKAEIESIRGVNSSEVLKKLLEKNLVTIVGRSDTVGRPLLYGTTRDFLRSFGLHSITDLPKPRELKELMSENAEELAKYKTIVVSDKENADEIEEKIRTLVGADKEKKPDVSEQSGTIDEQEPAAAASGLSVPNTSVPGDTAPGEHTTEEELAVNSDDLAETSIEDADTAGQPEERPAAGSEQETTAEPVIRTLDHRPAPEE